jgi:HAD superfamily hydrolase (TIGR01509 family)
MMSPTPRAVLFDIDGTLVDSNYVHIDAWARAFASLGHPVDSWRIHRAIGMDSALLLSTLLADDADRLSSEAKRLHSEFYARTTGLLRPFDRARELLGTLSARGMTVVLATSAPEDELAVLRSVLDVESTIAHVTSADDVGSAKPAPDLVRVALDKAGVTASDAVFVGDTVWDVIAAGRAGVPCIGVLSGGVSAAELLDAGAVAVYDDVAGLLDAVDTSPLV